HRRDPTSHLGVRAVTAAQLRLDGRLEHVDHVLDHPVQLVGRATTATAGGPGLRDRGLLVDDDPQRLWSAPSRDHVELDPLTRSERLHARQERIGADVDVLPSLLRQEAEALLRVIPLDLAAGHRDPPLNPAALDARTAPVRNTRDYPRRCRWPRPRQRPRRIVTLPV